MTSRGWAAAPGQESPRGRRRTVLVGLAVVLLSVGAAARYLIETASESAPNLDDTSRSELTDKRADVDVGQRLLQAAGGVGPDPLVDPTLFMPGGPPADGIPPIDEPDFVSASEVGWLTSREPVIAVTVGNDARAYPLQILTWHEIVNDVVGGVPISVTFCPLCNTAYAFVRPKANGKVTSLGTSGLLYNSNLVMYDRATVSLWPQALGKAVIGPLTGTRLERVPAQIVAWSEFRSAFPRGAVLSRDTGFDRRYGTNPYPGYDDVEKPPFAFSGRVDERLAAVERVLGVEARRQVIAFPYSELKDAGRGGLAIVQTEIGDEELVVFWKQGTVSALDAATISLSKDVGAASAFSSRLKGRTLRFAVRNGAITDEQTSSTWNVFGRAVGGPLEGHRLKPADAHDSFWFDWAAFHPDTKIWE